MNGHDRVYLMLGTVVSVWTFTVLAVVVFTGQPPRHCRYFVPVLGHPGIYSCSEFPLPVRVPR